MTWQMTDVVSCGSYAHGDLLLNWSNHVKLVPGNTQELGLHLWLKTSSDIALGFPKL